MKIRKGDSVVILAGKDRGKRGTVEKVMRQSHRVAVGGINMAKRHIKPSSKFPAGGIIELTVPMDWSNVKVEKE